MRLSLCNALAIAGVTTILGCGRQPQPTVAIVEARSIDPNSERAPSRFTSEVQYQVDGIGNRLRRDVERGKTSPGAMTEYNRQRAYVSQLLTQYSADQYIQDTERDHVRSVLREMEQIDDRYRAGRGGGPY